ncbi:type II toxin-antitoxin system VapC family toxin [Allochromatium palmeri]|uniref:Ribonuclease VapC n=1 Tax=Allochromatium palmeri TaxID=231048 RepID=A0A6N8EB42_9GAMM|nr:PIN domain-containing protein [Allochromatium palmeri]MTW20771.1 PIN domain-containing protein [Allochromatium palmeri]
MTRIYLDSCILIYLVERHPIFAPVIEARLATLKDAELLISPLVRLEVLVKPLRAADVSLLQRYRKFMDALHQLSMPDDVFDLALSLRVRYNLKTPDALHAATAQYHVCQSFWTNDHRLADALGECAVVVTHAN